MMQSSTVDTPSADKSVPSRAANCIDLLVERAKSDRKGVFWPVAPAFRNLPASQSECTLAFGVPGILLALLEYYRAVHDSDIAEVITKGKAWLDSDQQSRTLTPGFYFGSGGLWYLETELRAVFPDLQLPIDGKVRDLLNKLGTAPLARPSVPETAARCWVPLLCLLGTQAMFIPV